MKIPPLHAIDLANIPSIPLDQRRGKLEKIKSKVIIFNFNPLRSAWADIFNCGTELFGPLPATQWENIERVILQKSRSDEEYRYNIYIAQTLHRHCLENKFISRKFDFMPISLGLGRKIEFWLPLVIVSGDSPIVPFVDPRLGEKLSSSGRRFAFSVMHERIRVIDPDLSHARFSIIQFMKDLDADTKRRAISHFDAGVVLMTFDELDAAVSETYQIWEEIHAEREEKARRVGGIESLL